MFYLSSHQVWKLLFISFVVLFIASESKEPQEVNAGWSAPMLFYKNPDMTEALVFGTDVFENTISVVQQQFDTTGGVINYSKVFLIHQESGSELQQCQISSDNYPAEQPSILRTNPGNLNIFWGERRVDPELEQRNVPIPLWMASSLLHTELHNCTDAEPTEVYEGSLSMLEPGAGELRLPASVTTGTGEQLYLSFGAEGEFSELPEDKTPGVAVLSRDDSGVWQDPRFTLLLRFNHAITGSETNHLVLPHLGAPPLLPGGNANELYVITSDDGGYTWSEPIDIFTEANPQHEGRILGSYLQANMLPNGQVHLMFEQNRDSGFGVFANTMWHTLSNDYGKTWTSPTDFFGVQRPDEEHYHFIRNWDMMIDHSGQVHWAGVTHLGGVQGIEQSELHYRIWRPESRSWVHSEVIPFEGHPGSMFLSIDKPENKLYLFWEEETGESFGKREGVYYTFRDLEEENQLPPVISEAGPLKLHANFPNPFAFGTTIPFTLEEPGQVVLNIYDTGGRRVLQRSLGTLTAGFYQENITSEMLSSGMYIYEFIVNGTYRQEEKMVVIK